jgi:propanediol dehydratase small subunit
MKRPLGTADYPLSEKRPEMLRGKRGRPLDAITLEALLSGEVDMEDLRITAAALELQADIARAARRPMLAANFERASEMVDIPQDLIMEVYELLRPGRAASKDQLLDAAARLRSEFAAERMAAFIEEAAAVYERRGLFTYRF